MLLVFPLYRILIAQFTLVCLWRLNNHGPARFPFFYNTSSSRVAFRIVINDFIRKLKFCVFETNSDFPGSYFQPVFINQPLHRPLSSIHSDWLSWLHFFCVIWPEFGSRPNNAHVVPVVGELFFDGVVYRELYFEVFPFIINLTDLVLLMRWRCWSFSLPFAIYWSLRWNSANYRILITKHIKICKSVWTLLPKLWLIFLHYNIFVKKIRIACDSEIFSNPKVTFSPFKFTFFKICPFSQFFDVSNNCKIFSDLGFVLNSESQFIFLSKPRSFPGESVILIKIIFNLWRCLREILSTRWMNSCVNFTVFNTHWILPIVINQSWIGHLTA